MHVNQSITARAMFSELMLGGATINSKAASAGRKGCHGVIIWEEKILQVAPAQKRKKNGAPCNAWTAALACLAAVFWFMALKNIPSLTGR
jgi:hypothetical protein